MGKKTRLMLSSSQIYLLSSSHEPSQQAFLTRIHSSTGVRSSPHCEVRVPIRCHVAVGSIRRGERFWPGHG